MLLDPIISWAAVVLGEAAGVAPAEGGDDDDVVDEAELAEVS